MTSLLHSVNNVVKTIIKQKDHYIYRKIETDRFKKTETKLLYTLHWLILDAASECEDNRVAAAAAAKKLANKNKVSITHRSQSSTKHSLSRKDKEINKIKTVTYLHPVATVQLFVYLFVPIIKSLQADDLDNLKLVNGLKIWQPLWAHRTPDVPIFSTFVKPNKQKEEQTNETNKRNLSNGSAVSPFEEMLAKPEEFSTKATQSLTPTAFTRMPSSKSSQGLPVPSNFGSIYMGDQAKTTTLMPPDLTNKRQSVTSVTSSQYDSSNEKKISITSVSSSSSLNTQADKSSPKPTNLEVDSIRISDFETDQIKDSDMNLKVKSTLRAPIVHMNSICSFSDGAPSFTITPQLEESDIDQQTDICCPNCKRTSVEKKNSVSSVASSKNCQSCFQLMNTSESFAIGGSGNRYLAESEVFAENDLDVKVENDKNLSVDNHSTQSQFKKELSFSTKQKQQKQIQLNENINMNTRSATYFDIAVMRCLLCSKWNTEGYLWALEFLSYRVNEITDYTLKEQDLLLNLKSTSMPFNIDELCVQMGIGSNDDSETLWFLIFFNLYFKQEMCLYS